MLEFLLSWMKVSKLVQLATSVERKKKKNFWKNPAYIRIIEEGRYCFKLLLSSFTGANVSAFFLNGIVCQEWEVSMFFITHFFSLISTTGPM